MNAVWSFWNKPYERSHGLGWADERYHLLSWILSLETARPYFNQTALYTDDAGVKLLIDGLGLEFDIVSTALNALDDADSRWWVAGKLLAYRSQTEPFVHIDTDVYLWQGLPDRLTNAPVFAQHPEFFELGNTYYIPERFTYYIEKVGGWIPDELVWYMPFAKKYQAACCGILGGCRTDFLGYYADLALRYLSEPCNQAGWQLLGEANGMTLEQFFLVACVMYHRDNTKSPFAGIDLAYLFDRQDDVFSADVAADLGYTHLIGDAKKNVTILRQLEYRVQRDYPELYQRCVDFLQYR